jgi:aspartate aminotransferase-like enzyme
VEICSWQGSDELLPHAPSYRRGIQADVIARRLREDARHRIKAVCVVHNETSTGVTSDIAAVRRALDSERHPALLMVDTISGLASADYRHDEWGVDVSVSGSQKGLMLPPGLGFNALSPRALESARSAQLPRSYWAWDEIVEMNKDGYWPYTPATNLLQLRRIALHEGEGKDVPVAWLNVGDGTLSLLRQRYERRGARTYWYEAPRFEYAAMLDVDDSGFPKRYPDLWEAQG